MSEDIADSVIHRKAQVARDGFDAREMSPSKALRLSLAKSAARLMGLAITVRTVEQTVLPLSKIESSMGDDGLLILLDGPERARGVVRLDLQAVAALIEMQLKGRVKQAEAAPRPFTPTDAAIAQPLINAVLEGFDQSMSEAGIADGASGFRFGDRVADAKTLALALSEPEFDHFRLNLDLAGGAKSGVLDVVLPKAQHEPEGKLGEDGGELALKLEENALNAPVILDATLGRVRVPLQDICNWKAGTVVPLSPDVLSEARLLGAEQHVVATVKLGQLHGFRAVRLIDESAERGFGQPDARSSEDVTVDSLGMAVRSPAPELPSLADVSSGAPVDLGTEGPEPDLTGLAEIQGSEPGPNNDAYMDEDAEADVDLEHLLAASALPTPAE